jgi:hypothetical protein
VIDFRDWPIEVASRYGECFEIVERLVRAERQDRRHVNKIAETRAKTWWQFASYTPNLYEALNGKATATVIPNTSKYAIPAVVSANAIFSNSLAVVASEDVGLFAVLSSGFHYWWAVAYASTLETRIRYAPSDVFETFPQPEPQSGPRWEAVDAAGRDLNEFRADLMIRTNLGLTKTYNRVHNPDEQHPDIVRLRELHVVLDHGVRDAYGWSDLALDHHHWTTPQGMRFTVSPPAKDELLDRLLELNHERYAAEVAAGLHAKKSKKAPVKRRATGAGGGQESML